MVTFRKFFTLIQDRREKVVVLLLIIIVIYSITNSSFLQMSLQKVNPRFHTMVTNTLPVELAWSYNTREIIKVPPQVNSKVIVLLRGDRVLTALDIQTGDVRWEYNLGANIGLPESKFVYFLDEERLVITINNAQLLALNVENGEKIWQRDMSSSTAPTPNIMFVGDSIIVSAFSATPSTEGYIASYQLDNGDFTAHMFFPSRTFEYQFPCPHLLEHGDSGKQMVCVTLYDRLLAIDSGERLNVVKTYLGSFYSLDIPYYQNGLIFTNPSPNPSPQVFDTGKNRGFALPTYCAKDNTSHPITSNGDLILVSTGCDELYAMNINHLEQEPSWIFTSESGIYSSLVTVNGAIGYALNAKGEIVGINLTTGEEIGRVMTEPDQLGRGQFRNSLTVHAPYLYALMDGNTLLAFKHKP